MNPSPQVQNVLDKLDRVSRSGGGWSARCPAHDDQHPSLSVAEGADGKALLKCFAGCQPEAIIAALGLNYRDLFPSSGNAAPHEEGLTLDQLAAAKRLESSWLMQVGLSDTRRGKIPAVEISYFDETGNVVATRFRVALHGDHRFAWKGGSKLRLYGLKYLTYWRRHQPEYIVLVEGETDAMTLWLHGEPAVGVPGASTWKDDWESLLEGFGSVYVVVEPDRGGEQLLERLRKGSEQLRARLRLVRLRDVNDVNELYLRHGGNFLSTWTHAKNCAVPLTDEEAQQAREAAEAAYRECSALTENQSILDEFAACVAQRGFVGEVRGLKLLYLIVTSRLLQRPLAIAIKGPSSAGKSSIVENVLPFFPSEAYYCLSAMSPLGLVYSGESFVHRVLVLYEAAGLRGETATYLVRSLLSEGRIRYQTVGKNEEGPAGRLIEKPGPTGLITTTTDLFLHPENETRMLSLTVSDSAQQTAQIMAQLAEPPEERPESELRQWHALQTWLAAGEHRVSIPYGKTLSQLVASKAVRMRRDFGALLSLLRVHAILHQATRSRNGKGEIVATLDDYAAIHALVADLIGEGAEESFPAIVRQTVGAVERLLDSPQSKLWVSVKEVAAALGIDASAASRRVKQAISMGYLRNNAERRGVPSQISLDEPLPGDSSVLPAPEHVHACMQSGGVAQPQAAAGIVIGQQQAAAGYGQQQPTQPQPRAHQPHGGQQQVQPYYQTHQQVLAQQPQPYAQPYAPQPYAAPSQPQPQVGPQQTQQYTYAPQQQQQPQHGQHHAAPSQWQQQLVPQQAQQYAVAPQQQHAAQPVHTPAGQHPPPPHVPTGQPQPVPQQGQQPAAAAPAPRYPNPNTGQQR